MIGVSFLLMAIEHRPAKKTFFISNLYRNKDEKIYTTRWKKRGKFFK
jgi:hypothetical protein